MRTNEYEHYETKQLRLEVRHGNRYHLLVRVTDADPNILHARLERRRLCIAMQLQPLV